MEKIDCIQIVKDLRDKKYLEEKKRAIKQAEEGTNLLEKCVLLRVYTSPQSTDAEKLIKKDLNIQNAGDNISGDGIKNGIKYEIKVSLHDEKCKVNIRQIRPHHDVDYYIIVALNLFEGENGKAYIFKIPSDVVYDLVVDYGGYTHGTVAKNGVITKESIKDKNKLYEYSLSPDPNSEAGNKSKRLWEEFLKYEQNYKEDEF